MTYGEDNPFRCLFAISISSLVRCLLRCFAHFLIGWLISLLLSFEFLFILDNSPLSDTVFANISLRLWFVFPFFWLYLSSNTRRKHSVHGFPSWQGPFHSCLLFPKWLVKLILFEAQRVILLTSRMCFYVKEKVMDFNLILKIEFMFFLHSYFLQYQFASLFCKRRSERLEDLLIPQSTCIYWVHYCSTSFWGLKMKK